MTRSGILLAGLVLACAAEAFTQNRVELEFGARAGIPFSISIESGLTGVASTLSSQAYDRSPFSIGPTITGRFFDRVTVELDSLYKTVHGRGAAFSPTLPTTSSTEGSSWEFPLVADYQFVKSPIRFYMGGGLVVAETTRGSTEIRTTDTRSGTTTVRTEKFRASPSQLPAYIVNSGMEWRAARVVIRPELRFTRWSSVTQSTIAARRPNQFEYLIGFSFRGYK